MSLDPAIEPLLTAAEVGQVLGCSQDHVMALYRAGKLPAVGLGTAPLATGRPGRRMLRFRPGDVRDLVAALTTTIEQAPSAPASTARAAAVPVAVGSDDPLWGKKKAKAKR